MENAGEYVKNIIVQAHSSTLDQHEDIDSVAKLIKHVNNAFRESPDRCPHE